MAMKIIRNTRKSTKKQRVQTPIVTPIEENPQPRDMREIMLYNANTVMFGNMLLNRVTYDEARLIYQSGARLWSALSENIISLHRGMLVSKKECRLKFKTLVPFNEWHEYLRDNIGGGFFTPHYWAIIA